MHNENQENKLEDWFEQLGFARLRNLANAARSKGLVSPTLNPTALVNELWIRWQQSQPEFVDENDFRRLAIRKMREFLIDHLRRSASQKRGGGVKPYSLSDQDSPPLGIPTTAGEGRVVEILALNDALDRLRARHPKVAEIIECHYFGQLNIDEVAAICKCHTNTVRNRLRLGEAFLKQELALKSAYQAPQ